MSRQDREAGRVWSQFLKVSGGFLALGGLMFMHAWWPIQAERLLLHLKKSQTLVSQKKIELNALKERYSNLTSLSVLDHWAKKNGPWVSPKAENVIPINV